ncbi:hypothetical protein, partial [Rhodopirellula baltica]|uniref:hypothetical protein n=1 Tax=Rhodopirellula baltica TaxID=265606 RepID=UPI001F1DE92B
LSDAGESPLTPNPYESPTDSAGSTRWHFRIRPYRRSVFVLFLTAALIAGLFVPTIEMFKGTMSMGRMPLWLSYVGLFTPEYWPLPFGIILAHWVGHSPLLGLRIACCTCLRPPARSVRQHGFYARPSAHRCRLFKPPTGGRIFRCSNLNGIATAVS